MHSHRRHKDCGSKHKGWPPRRNTDSFGRQRTDLPGAPHMDSTQHQDLPPILMLNKFAKPVAEKVRMNTFRLFGLTAGIVALGLILLGIVSSRMLRLLQNLTWAAEGPDRENISLDW